MPKRPMLIATVLLLSAAPILCSAISTPAAAQAEGMAGIGESETLSLRATVQAIDQQTRMITLVGPQGNSLTMHVGDQVQNLAQVKQGDSVIVRYHGSVAFVLAPPGSKGPRSAAYGAVSRAAPGQIPAGELSGKLVVTSTVVGVDPASHTLQLVNPAGGPVWTVAVTTQEGQRAMNMIKVGDTITAVISRTLALAVEPVT